MEGGNSKSSGSAGPGMRMYRTLLLMVSMLLLAASSAPGLTAVADIEPARAPVGEAATLSIRIDGTGAPEPVSVPEVEGLSIAYNGTRRSFQSINGRSRSETALSFSVVPHRSGSFTIPPITLRRGEETIRSNPVTFLAYAGGARTMRGAGPVGGLVRVSKGSVVAGEPILLRFYLVHPGIDLARSPVFDKMPAMKGFLLKQVDEALPEESVRAAGGDYVRSHVATFAAVPLEGGRFAVGGGTMSVTVAEADPGSFFPFAVPTTRRVDFDTVTVTVNPLPVAGKPAGFRGDVGTFSIRAEFPGGAAETFRERRLTIRIAGRGNLISLARPEFVKVDGLSIIGSDGPVRISTLNGSIEGEREFIYTVIPERPGRFVLPGPGLSYYNPASGRYETARTPDIVFEAAPGVKEGKGERFDDAEQRTRLEFDPLAALGIILLAAVGIAAAVWWRRRESVVAEKESQLSDERVAPAPVRVKDRRADLANAARRRDGDLFLKTAELMFQEARGAAWYEGAEESLKMRLDDLRRRIGQYRYAGRPLSDGEMEDLYRRLRELFR